MLLCSVSLFANNRDTCQITAAITGTVMINFVNHNPVGNPPLSGPITANFTGIIVPSPSGTFSINITTPVSGTITGTLIGTLAGTITNHTTGAFTGTFVGIASGTLAAEYGNGNVTGNINDGVATGVVICSKDTCGQKLNCPEGVKYPYLFCVLEKNGDTRKITECVEDPLDYEATHSDSFPKTFSMKAKLPICLLNVNANMNTIARHFSSYKTGGSDSKEVVLFGVDYTQSVSLLFLETIAAIDKWNCVCGYTSSFPCSTVIRYEFTENPNLFRDPLDVKNTSGFATRAEKPYQIGNEDDYNCNFDYDNSKIYFNATSLYLFDLHDFPSDPNTPLIRGWVAQEYIGNLNSPLIPKSPDVGIISFQQVLLHELGHMLGFGHYDTMLMTGQTLYPCGDTLLGVMKHNIDDARRENTTELSLHDKCMFSKLYCPTVGIAYEKLPARPIIIVAPNPTKNEVNITFEVKDGNKKVSIELTNEEGKTFGTLLSERQYDEGMHTCTAKLKHPAGAYFILIKIGNIIYSEKVIIAK